jgi:putative DNA primase/helicase
MQEDRAVDKYSPLTEKERACGGIPPNPPEDDSWELIVPVPADAPRAPGVHPTLGKPLARWGYYDAKGGFLFAVCRWNTADGGKIFLPMSLWRHESGRLEWRWKSVPAPRPLYNLDKLA